MIYSISTIPPDRQASDFTKAHPSFRDFKLSIGYLFLLRQFG